MMSNDALRAKSLHVQRLRSQNALLASEVILLEQRLDSVQKDRESIPTGRGLDYISVRKYQGIKLKRALAYIRKGYLDPGIIRDLSDAALFGYRDAALVLAEIGLKSKIGDAKKRNREALIWLLFALSLSKEPLARASAALDDVKGKMSQAEIEDAQQAEQRMERVAGELQQNPYLEI
jgi:hypothetical protein